MGLILEARGSGDVLLSGMEISYSGLTIEIKDLARMADPAQKLMTVEEFLIWCLDQEDRWELVDGVPVRLDEEHTETVDGVVIKMMTGASTLHDRIVVNMVAELRQQLRGTRCIPTTADVGLRTKRRSLRRPDVLVMGDAARSDVYEAADAKMAVEVLSPSNKGIRWQRKLEEYRLRDGLIYILLIASDEAKATLISRAGEAWTPSNFDGRDGVIELPAIGCKLAMAEIFDGLVFAEEG
jgi:Uma2 family endonuclease